MFNGELTMFDPMSSTSAVVSRTNLVVPVTGADSIRKFSSPAFLCLATHRCLDRGPGSLGEFHRENMGKWRLKWGFKP